MNMRRVIKGVFVSAALSAALAAHAEEVVRIGFIDPLSGPFGAAGDNALKTAQFAAERVNQQHKAGDVRFELVPMDNKGSAQEALAQFRAATDDGLRYIIQGSSSAIALALSDAVAKYSERNKDKSVLYINYGALDPDLTNGKCTFWHFRLDSNSDMRAGALTSYMAQTPSIKKVYLINPNISFGQQFNSAVKKMLPAKRADARIVGEDLVPIGQVKDFTPYVAKIRSSGADTIVTGMWASDLTLLAKAVREAGLQTNLLTYYAGAPGTPTALGASGANRVKMLGTYDGSLQDSPEFAGLARAFKARYHQELFLAQLVNGIDMLAAAIKDAKSTDPVVVGKKMAGMRMPGLFGTIEMRAADHQMLQPLFLQTFAKVDGKTVTDDVENTGYGWRLEQKISAEQSTLPTTCKMRVPD